MYFLDQTICWVFHFKKNVKNILLTFNETRRINIIYYKIAIHLKLKKIVIMKELLLLIFMLFNFCVFGQELPSIIQPSPNASSIARYGDTPVSHNTGTPTVSIPLYTLASSEFQQIGRAHV